MKHKKQIGLIWTLLTILTAQAQDTSNDQSSAVFDTKTEVEWINPFPENGFEKSYQMQSQSGDAQKLFEVKSDRIEVLYNWPDGKAPFGTITTTKEYSYFNFEFSYKWGKRKFAPRDTVKRDAGFLFHVNGEKIIWPTSLECQVQQDDTGDLWVIKGPKVTVINTDGTQKEVDASGKKQYQRNIRYENLEKKGWNHVRVEVRGDKSARYFVNGKLVNELINFTLDDKPLGQGAISLQAEGSELIYKGIRLQNLE